MKLDGASARKRDKLRSHITATGGAKSRRDKPGLAGKAVGGNSRSFYHATDIVSSFRCEIIDC